MKSFPSVLSCVLFGTTVRAFAPISQPKHPHSTVALEATKSRIQQSGCGIPVVPAGNRNLFDPSVEGILGGTPELDQRLQGGSSYHYVRSEYLPQVARIGSDITTSSPPSPATTSAQAWLEDLPKQTPVRATQPMTATVLGRAKLIADTAPGNIQHVVLQLPPNFPKYVEGQSLSVIPPGVMYNGKRHKPRLYSIASTRYGDLLDGQTVLSLIHI